MSVTLGKILHKVNPARIVCGRVLHQGINQGHSCTFLSVEHGMATLLGG